MIEWTEQAIRQLDQAHDYIALSNSEEVATRITLPIVNSVEHLAAFPMSGRAGRVPGTRELVISRTPFIAAYAVEKARIVILAVYHGAQHWPEEFLTPGSQGRIQTKYAVSP
jgi:toxin ParE1/3/4